MKKIYILLISMILMPFVLNAQSGNVGIGTTTPQAKLHVQGDMVAVDTLKLTSPIDPPVSGAGTRLMWYGDKAAFRVGYLSQGGATFWNKDSIGYYSIGMGKDIRAIGEASAAIGDSSLASGINSYAFGYKASAVGDYTFAQGKNAEARGEESIAFGKESKALGSRSLSIGNNVIGSGSEGSIVVGNLSNSTGLKSIAIGNGVDALADYSLAIGAAAEASGVSSLALGGARAAGMSSVSIGNDSYASAENSVAIGTENIQATGISSVAIGNGGVASGDSSIVVGAGTASGTRSTSIGSSLASGYGATSFGIETKAESYASTALGRYNVGGGSATLWNDLDPLFEIGNGTADLSRSNAMTIYKNGNTEINGNLKLTKIGNGEVILDLNTEKNWQFRQLGTGAATALELASIGDSGDKNFIINTAGKVGIGNNSPNENLVIGDDLGIYPGNRISIGDIDNLSGINIGEDNDNRGYMLWENTTNYMTFGTESAGSFYGATLVLKDGNVGIGTNSPASRLEVNGGARIDGATFNVDNVNNRVGVGTLSPLHPLQMGSGAHVTSSGIWVDASDNSKKYDVNDAKYGLSEVLALRPVNFKYTIDQNEGLGFIAQEVEDIVPEIVSGNEGSKGIAYGMLTAVLVNAVKEVNNENLALKLEIKNLNKIIQEQHTRSKELHALLEELSQRIKTLEVINDK